MNKKKPPVRQKVWKRNLAKAGGGEGGWALSVRSTFRATKEKEKGDPVCIRVIEGGSKRELDKELIILMVDVNKLQRTSSFGVLAIWISAFGP